MAAPSDPSPVDPAARHVLLVAYACHPDQGSEPGAGWQWLRAVAERHQVTVLTGRADDDRLEQEVARLGLPVTVVRVTTPADVIGIDSRLRYLRYGAWLRAARRPVRELERAGLVDVGQHVTYASDWLPSPLSALRTAPYVWGPVGGATYPSAGLVDGLSLRSRVFEATRRTVGRVSRLTFAAATARRAGLVVALNEETARAWARRRVVIEPNAAIDYGTIPPAVPSAGERRAVYAGRLLPWKGIHLAVRAMADARLADWTFEIFGDGSEQAALQRLAEELGLPDRVRFRGRIPRDELLRSVATADAFVFPSLHDSAPWAVAEASALGVPVLCFRAGAAPTLAGPCLRALDADRPVDSIVDRLADLADSPPDRTPYREFAADRLPTVVQKWFDALTPP